MCNKTSPTLITFAINDLTLWTEDGNLEFYFDFHRGETNIILWRDSFTVMFKHVLPEAYSFFVVFKNGNLRFAIEVLIAFKLQGTFSIKCANCSPHHCLGVSSPKFWGIECFHGLVERYPK